MTVRRTRYLSSTPARRRSILGAAVVLPWLMAPALVPLRQTVSDTATALVLVLVIVAAASSAVRWAGLAASLSSGLVYDIVSTQPFGRLRVESRLDLVTTVLLVLIGTGVAGVSAWARAQWSRAESHADYFHGLVETSRMIRSQAPTDREVLELVQERIKAVLGVNRCRFVPGPVHNLQMPVLDHDGSLIRGGRRIDVDHDGLPNDMETALVASRDGVVVGSFRVLSAARVVRPSVQQRQVAVLLASQLAARSIVGPHAS